MKYDIIKYKLKLYAIIWMNLTNVNVSKKKKKILHDTIYTEFKKRQNYMLKVNTVVILGKGIVNAREVQRTSGMLVVFSLALPVKNQVEIL